MEKPNLRVGIDVNGVLRDTVGKVEMTYQKFMIDKTDGIEDDEIFEYKIIKPIDTPNLSNHFLFKNEEELFSFLYEEFPMEIFGHAQSAEYSTFNDFNDLYLNLRENIDFLVVSDEIGKSKPATLFFLSKFGCLTEKVKFYSQVTLESMWDELDVLITSNPNHLTNHPSDKRVIKYETQYNQHVNVDETIKTIKELNDKLKTLELC
jgi:hypothetical protein